MYMLSDQKLFELGLFDINQRASTLASMRLDRLLKITFYSCNI